MADNFLFQDGDATVRQYLNNSERDAVDVWQKNETYTFEFHEGHGTGYPIYVRINGNKDTSNLPKFDTKNKNPSHYHAKGKVSVGTLANGGKLTKNLASVAQADIEAVITGSWESLTLLAMRRWTNTFAPPDVAAAATDKPCSDGTCRGRVPLKAPVKGKATKMPCSDCGVFQ